MINFEIITARYNMSCAGENCKRLPEYIVDRVIKQPDLARGQKDYQVWAIINGTKCLIIGHEGEYVTRKIYCYDCIDDVYAKIIPVLDKKLWALK